MALMSGPRYDAHGRRVYDDDVFDGIGRADKECRLCGGQGWYVNRYGPDGNVEQVQCECAFEERP